MTAHCVAIGGVLKLSSALTKNPLFLQTWSNDNNESAQPWYIEYFGYTNGPFNPPYTQIPQDLSCKTNTVQPAGTTYSWSIPSYTYSADLASNQGEANITDITATSSGKGEPVICTYHWTGTLDGATITDFQAADDTTQTPLYSFQNDTYYMPDKVSAHEPSNVQEFSYQVVDSSLMHCETDYLMDIVDSFKGPMPNVYVTEHFTDETPTGFKTDYNLGIYWTALGASACFNDLDHLSWTFEYFPSPWYAMNTYSFHHIYYAATQSANGPWNLGTTYGIACGTYDIQFVPYDPDLYHSTAQQ